MNIVMMTNTYTPHVGGVANSVAAFAEGYRRRGHRVLVVAPVFPDMPTDEPDVIRIPAWQNFNGSDFSVVLPVPTGLDEALDGFAPDIIHAHHPFLIGSTALRVAAERRVPLVFTHHTLYECYTHYVPGDSPALKRFVMALSTHFANSCDQVFAPSQSVAALIRDRGVTTPIRVVPTGVDVNAFARGDGAGFRHQTGIPAAARVIGHVGRLAEEKNLGYLAEAMIAACRDDAAVRCLVVGDGAAAEAVDRRFENAGLAERLIRPGAMTLPRLADAYAAMDAFAFASLTETQGMVVAEAMAAGLPVVALDAPGVREVVDHRNGRLLPTDSEAEAMGAALVALLNQPSAEAERMGSAVAATARAFAMERSVATALAHYQGVIAEHGPASGARRAARDRWQESLRGIQAEWAVIRGLARAAGKAIASDKIPDYPR
jgi:glycosyltransferase involved in cell wall biosynthesis